MFEKIARDIIPTMKAHSDKSGGPPGEAADTALVRDQPSS
jgi:hypothetical protein